MGHSRLHLVYQFAHSTVHLRHARRPSVPIVTYRPPGMDCSENLLSTPTSPLFHEGILPSEVSCLRGRSSGRRVRLVSSADEVLT